MAKQILNNLETYGVIRNKINDNFTDLYDNKSDNEHTHEQLHHHTNKNELDKIGEDELGKLTYNGLPIEGGSGVSDYEDLSNKPTINNIELTGNKTLADLGIQPVGDYLTEVPSEYVTDTELESKGYATTSQIPDVSNKLEISNILQGSNIILTKVGNDITINSTGEGGSGGSIVADSEINGNILIDGIETNVYEHPSGTNPHGTTKADIGLENVNNTSDLNKPISDATQTALNGKAESIHTHDYSKVEESLENGNIILNETETNIYTLPSNIAKIEDLHSHDNKDVLDDISQTNIDNWNSKSDFSGSYNDLIDKPNNIMTSNVYDPQNKAEDIFQYVDNAVSQIASVDIATDTVAGIVKGSGNVTIGIDGEMNVDISDKIDNSEKGVTIATLVDGKVPDEQLPPISSSASDITYNNTESGLQSSNVQGVVDEINNNLGDFSSQLADIANDVEEIDESLDGLVGTRRKFYDAVGEMANIKKIYILPFNLEAKTKITRTRFEITQNVVTAIYNIAVYDANYNLVCSSGVKETFMGINDVSLSNTILEPGEYYFAICCNNTGVKFRSVKTHRALSSEYSFPLPVTLGNLYEEDIGIYFELFSISLVEPTGFSISREPTRRVFAKGGSSALYGWNTSTWKICKSVTFGEWTDLMDAHPNGFWAMEVDEANGNIYTLSGEGKIFKSSDLTASATWTNITPDITLQRIAISLPYSMKLWGGYLWFGEYSHADLGELNGGPIISRYNVATGQWKKSAQIPNCRHVHSFVAQGSVALYVSCGDLNTGVNVGYHRLLTSGINDSTGDTWTRWTKTDGENNRLYDVDATLVPSGINGVAVILGSADQPKTLLSATKIENTSAGSVNISSQCRSFVDSPAMETVRNVILDSRNNCYFLTSSDKPRLCVSPPPYTEAFILHDFEPGTVITSKVLSGDYIFMSDWIIHTVDFGKVTKTVNTRRYIFNNKTIDALSYLASGSAGESIGVVNPDNILLSSTVNQESVSQRAGYWTTSKIDTTGYKRLYIEGEFFDSYGNSMLQTILSSDINYSSDVVGVNQAATSQHSRGEFKVGLNLSEHQGLYHIHFRTYAAGLKAQTKVRITKIYLSKVE